MQWKLLNLLAIEEENICWGTS